MKNTVYVVSIGYDETKLFAHSVFKTKEDAIESLKDNEFVFYKHYNRYFKDGYPYEFAKIEKMILNKFNE